MDISSISGVSMVEEPSPNKEAPAQEMDRDAFIKMFLAQMKHQDPLNPMDGSEFASQLAQFSSLEQLYNVNESLDGLQTLQQDRSQYEVLGLIGREITAEGNHMALGGEGPARGGFDLAQDAECAVVIKNEAGAPVRGLSLGYLQSGRHEFEWDGKNGTGVSMPEGAYQFEITASSPYGEEVSTSPHMVGRVNRISLEQGMPTLYMGDIPLELASVLDIQSADTEEASYETTNTDDDPMQEVGI